MLPEFMLSYSCPLEAHSPRWMAYEKGARLDSNSETAACRGWVRPERDLFSFVRLVARRSSVPKLDAALAKAIHENLGFLFTAECQGVGNPQ
jgi:hypothetical protein